MLQESLEKKLTRTQKIIKTLTKNYPDAKCTLNYKTVHQLMVATILSAQCTDVRVNKVTPELFRKYKSIKAFSAADLNELEKMVYTTGFYVNKSKAIKNSAIQIIKKHGGRIPRKLNQLVKLSGIGRKTASVILGVGYGLAEGIVVDTHIGRISRLLGLTKEKDPVYVEKDLICIIPKNNWIAYSHLLIYHGRAVCVARRPACGQCSLKRLCPSAIIKT